MPAHPNLPPLSPAMRMVLEQMARAGRPPLHSLPAQMARAAYELGSGVLDLPRAELFEVRDLAIPARDGTALKARLYRPSAKRLPALLYYHGGGFVIGSVETHDALCRQLAQRSGAAVLSLDYRLAPEHRFPTAVHDAWDALSWLRTRCGELGLRPERLAVGGDSAGGTLAAVTALHARDQGWPLALQLLFYPGTSGHFDTPSHQAYTQGLVLDRPILEWFRSHYAHEHEWADWRAAPARADDHSDLAPTWIGLAELDPLYSEGVDYADRLRAAGVSVDLDIYRGVTHEFIKMGRAVPEAQQAHADAAAALRRALGLD